MEATSINQCECQGGSYHKLARVGELCEECPHGMYCQGARFDTKTMKMGESKPGELFDPMPVIWLKPCKAEEYNPTSCYSCPMYKTSIRAGTLSTTGHSTNFVVSLHLPSDEEENHWIRRGTAMLLMLDT